MIAAVARRVGLLAALLCLAPPGAAPAQPDLARLLVGRWEGQLTGVPTNEFGATRALVIRAVEEKDGRWVAPATYGIPGRAMGNCEVAIQVVDGVPILDFVTPGAGGGHKVSLKLAGDVLRGTMRVRGLQREGELRLTRVSGPQ